VAVPDPEGDDVDRQQSEVGLQAGGGTHAREQEGNVQEGERDREPERQGPDVAVWESADDTAGDPAGGSGGVGL